MPLEQRAAEIAHIAEKAIGHRLSQAQWDEIFHFALKHLKEVARQ